jgi:hypothetical protein
VAIMTVRGGVGLSMVSSTANATTNANTPTAGKKNGDRNDTRPGLFAVGWIMIREFPFSGNEAFRACHNRRGSVFFCHASRQ